MLEFNLPTIILEIANFLLLSLALYYFLFRPVMKRVEERAEKKAHLERKIEEDQAEAARLRAEWEERLEKIEEEVAHIIQESREQLEKDRQEVINSIDKQVEKILKETKAEARRLQEHEIQNFFGDLVDAVVDISANMITQIAPEEVHNALVQQLIERVWELGRSEISTVETLRRSLRERSPTVLTETARDLSPEQQRELARTFNALADRDVNFELMTDRDLASGMRVRLGDIVFDNTIKAQLDNIREQVTKELEEHLDYA